MNREKEREVLLVKQTNRAETLKHRHTNRITKFSNGFDWTDRHEREETYQTKKRNQNRY